jgi:hypothetical protein
MRIDDKGNSMDKHELIALLDRSRADWERVITTLGPAGLEEPNACGEWRVRDVLAHFTGWERWQTVQLRSAFSGETPTMIELQGDLEFPPDDGNFSEDALNARNHFANQARPLDDVLADWREVSDLMSSWVGSAGQDQLDDGVGSDWGGGTTRVLRRVTEVPHASDPRPVWKWFADHVAHRDEHLAAVRRGTDASTS